LAGLPEICIDSLEIIKALEEGALSFRWEDERQAERFADILAACLTSLRVLQAQYNAA
jgi:hypothetical protein